MSECTVMRCGKFPAILIHKLLLPVSINQSYSPLISEDPPTVKLFNCPSESLYTEEVVKLLYTVDVTMANRPEGISATFLKQT